MRRNHLPSYVIEYYSKNHDPPFEISWPAFNRAASSSRKSGLTSAKREAKSGVLEAVLYFLRQLVSVRESTSSLTAASTKLENVRAVLNIFLSSEGPLRFSALRSIARLNAGQEISNGGSWFFE